MAATSPGDDGEKSIQASSIDGDPPIVTGDSPTSQPSSTENRQLVRQDTTSHPLDQEAEVG